jgi:putative transposase
VSEKYAFIRGEEGNYPTGLMISWMGVSASGFYGWRDRPLSARAARRAELALIVRWHFDDSDGTYGYRRIAAAMTAAGHDVGVDLVKSIMADEGLVAAQPAPLGAADHDPGEGPGGGPGSGGAGLHGR